jgi:glutamyl/glutaminyl-tRNA synthetase
VSLPRLRFAIPPGAAGLGIGLARDALFSWLLARSRGGTFLLRSDAGPAGTEEAERQIKDDLLWLGLGWDEGIDAEEQCGPYRRPQRLDLYRTVAVDLLRRGLACRCDCQRPPAGDESPAPTSCACREEAPAGGAGTGVEGAQSILMRASAAAGGGEVVFIDAARGEVRRPIEEAGDLVLLQPNGEPGPEFGTALDDAMMGITHVVSSADRPGAMCRQALVHAALARGPVPAFIQLPSIGGTGDRPAAQPGATPTVGRLRDEGYPPEAILNLLAHLGGATGGGQELLTREEMLAGFDPGRAAAGCRAFESQRLADLSARHLARMTPERLADLAAEHLAGAGLLGQPPSPAECAWAGAVARLYTGRLFRMSDLPAEVESLFGFDPGECLADESVRNACRAPASRRVIETLVESLSGQPQVEELTAVRFQALIVAVRRATGVKGRELYDALRVALTGRSKGPDLAQSIALIERGSRLPLPRRVAGCAERAKSLLEMTAGGGA